MLNRKRAVKYVLSLAAFGLYFLLSFTLPVYHYESSDRGFTAFESPAKGRNLEMVENLFEQYKVEKNNPGIKLYRTSHRIWYAPNLWIDNLSNRRWSYPYVNPSMGPK